MVTGVSYFAQIRSILKAKFGSDLLGNVALRVKERFSKYLQKKMFPYASRPLGNLSKKENWAQDFNRRFANTEQMLQWRNH